MPISKDEFRSINDDGQALLDLSVDTIQGIVYRLLLENADQAFSQREIVASLEVPEGTVGPTLQLLEQHGLVEHRDHFWTIADAEHAVVSAGLHGATTADEIDGGFSDDDVEAWMDTAVNPIGDDSGV